MRNQIKIYCHRLEFIIHDLLRCSSLEENLIWSVRSNKLVQFRNLEKTRIMKKILNVAGLFLFFGGVLSLNAQTYGVQLGVNSTDMVLENNILDLIPLVEDVEALADLLNQDAPDGEGLTFAEFADFQATRSFGFNFGPTVEFDLNDQFSLHAAALISQKGYASELKLFGSLLKANLDMRLTYVDVPLNVRYKMDLGEGKKAYVAAGPYVAYGVRSTESIGLSTILGIGADFDTHLAWDSERDLVDRLDYGLNGGFGFQLGRIDLGLQYRFGLADINKIDIEGFKISQNTLSLNAGFNF